MPPAAALECERTGWTLLKMATVAPASAAASAARWPARPAPMMRTSCAGMVGESIERGGQSVYGAASAGTAGNPPTRSLYRAAPHGARAYLASRRPRRRPLLDPGDH